MKSDFLGRIRNTRIPVHAPLLPVMEAIANSVHAIEDAGRETGFIEVKVVRDPGVVPPEEYGTTLPPITGFRIEDNGIGFNSINFHAFATSDTRNKEDRGGRGVGRLTWLKAFEYATVVSTFQEDAVWRNRRFSFRATDQGVEEHDVELRIGRPPKSSTSVIELNGFKDEYRMQCIKSTGAIAREILEHFFSLFFASSTLVMSVVDTVSNEIIVLNDVLSEEYTVDKATHEFHVHGHCFTLINALLKLSPDVQHTLFFCAGGRAVKGVQLKKKTAHLDTAIVSCGKSLRYAGYVTGKLLDDRLNTERTGFLFDERSGLAHHGPPCWEEIEEEAISGTQSFLMPYVSEARIQSYERARKYAETKSPRLLPALEYHRAEVEKIPVNASEQRLDGDLNRIVYSWHNKLEAETEQILATVLERADEPEAFEQEVRILAERLDTATKADLAEYVVRRTLMLRCFEKLLGMAEDSKFHKEASLHNIFFPRGRTSADIPYDSHQLWIIDERLAYHQYLASDLPFKEQRGPVRSESSNKPDIVIYNVPLAFQPGDFPYSSVVIIEFKRPERNDYSEEKNPIRQVLDYIQDIREGKAIRPDGSHVEFVEGTPFYCHIIATLTPSLRREAVFNQFIETLDRQGYFLYHRDFRAYIEISPFRKVLEDAKKRNRAFSERLHIRLP